MDAAAPAQTQIFLQLYVNRDREITKHDVQHAEKRGVKALFITVDAPQLGRREKDMCMKFVDESGVAKVQEGDKGVKKDEGVACAISVNTSAYPVARFHSLTGRCSLSLIHPYHGKIGSRASLPVSFPLSCHDILHRYPIIVAIVLKGVATPKDALMAYDHGLAGIVLF